MIKFKLSFHFKKTILVLAIILTSFSSIYAQSAAKKYIKAHSMQAMELMQQTGVPASVILGVAMVESSLGRSKNSKVLNNHFGIIGKNDLVKKEGYQSRFRQFSSAEASFENFVKVVTSKSFYADLKGSLDFKKWLLSLNKAGYCATQGNIWLRDINFFITRYSLSNFDKFAKWQKYDSDFFTILNH